MRLHVYILVVPAPRDCNGLDELAWACDGRSSFLEECAAIQENLTRNGESACQGPTMRITRLKP